MINTMKLPNTVLFCAFLACAESLFASPDQPIVEPIEVTKTYAESGDPVAQFNLGIRYGKGEGVTKNPDEELGWYKKAAFAGLASAQFNLGVAYANGDMCRVMRRKPSSG